MPLCDLCSNIDIRSMLAAAHERHEDPGSCDDLEALPEDIGPYKQTTVFEVRDHAETCDFCAIMWSDLQRRLEYYRRDEDVRLYVVSKIDDGTGKHFFWLSMSVGNITGCSYHRYQLYQPFLDNSDDSLASSLPKSLPKNLGSPGCLLKGKEWLNSCPVNHPDCHRVHEGCSTLPTRVIHVGDEYTHPSLHEFKGEAGSWTALSYCWGGTSEFVLNNSTYPRLLQGQPLESFPATIRDAIILTRALEIRYLWVDALCILQDSITDWDTEAPRISEIYTNAALTIIAAAVPSAYSGIFQDRRLEMACDLPWKRLKISRLSSHVGNTAAGLVPETILVQRMDVGSKDQSPNPYNSPWASRGWTLQEELLSWRTLTFMPAGMIWSCPSMQEWDSGSSVLVDPEFFPEEAQRVRPKPWLFWQA